MLGLRGTRGVAPSVAQRVVPCHHLPPPARPWGAFCADHAMTLYTMWQVGPGGVHRPVMTLLRGFEGEAYSH